jgi:deoxyribonuclease IV
MEIKVGLHVPISGGISNSVDNALNLHCSAFQIFSRNPRGWATKPLEAQEIKNFKTKLEASKIRSDSICVHMPYLPNLSSPNNSLYEKSTRVLLEELQRCSLLGIPYLVLHLGSNLGSGKENGINQFVNACSLALEKYRSSSPSIPAISATSSSSSSSSSQSPAGHIRTKKGNSEQNMSNRVTILLENNVGHKNTIGSRFEDIRLILERLNAFKDSIGICLDSCHAFAAGYDLRSKTMVDSTLDQFDEVIGLEHLKIVHLNDSRDELGSNLDRHENLGRGKIGNEGLMALCTHKSISSIPLIMETPRENHQEDMKTILNLMRRL